MFPQFISGSLYIGEKDIMYNKGYEGMDERHLFNFLSFTFLWTGSWNNLSMRSLAAVAQSPLFISLTCL